MKKSIRFDACANVATSILDHVWTPPLPNDKEMFMRFMP